ncbi:MAG TPA: uroporphyrinogen decarboxylase family protein, partial [Candidatus Sulfotelmatobacter sp.]|nr:uroporphyrinogen decarboxylase family protein [Candidatus Sulfotelmatobacter sp.]
QPNCFNQLVLASARRLALPISTYPALALTGATVREVVTNSRVQVEAQAALHQRYQLPFVLSAMDLSAEAEAFGCALHLSDNEIPSVVGRLVTDLDQARKLPLPKPGDRRTAVSLEAVARLKKLPGAPLVLGGCIGPFSLAARLVGVSEALELTLSEPDLMQEVLDKSTTFLSDYARAFKAAGADGLIMAEPAAGLLSPRGVAGFSSPYIRQIAAALEDSRFALILHNCAAKLLHLPAILETGLTTFHFGAPMDLAAALGKVSPEVVLCGNLDPTSIFCQLRPEEVRTRTAGLLSATAAHRNHVLSSGCDLPPGTPLASLDAFYAAVREGQQPVEVRFQRAG